uniref:Sterol C-14 reductase n=1 Tax=Triticum aestivum TaxID=4565 RepID=B5QT74_WHEAT|nr:sterol C-14 reductase [Triticum aestivum]
MDAAPAPSSPTPPASTTVAMVPLVSLSLSRKAFLSLRRLLSLVCRSALAAAAPGALHARRLHGLDDSHGRG